MQHLTFKYRLLPTRAQHRALECILEDQRQLYNAALQERIECYRKTGKGRSYIDQCRSLTELRKDGDFATVPLNLQRWTIKRLDDAYNAFFRRLKTGNARSGFPRFRGTGWWNSFGFREWDGITLHGNKVRFKGMPGALRVHLHRPLPTMEMRSCTLSRDGKGWSISLQVGIEMPAKRPISSSVGIDLGLTLFAYQSDGVVIPNPRVARKAERKMRLRQRALARCKRGSNRRRKVKGELARLHCKIANTRTTWLHQQSARIAKSYDLIAAEDLNVTGMIKNPTLSRSIADASWSKFLAMVAYKAERAGGHFVTVDPRNTSQKCSGCHELVPKALAVRTHSCPSCGLVIDRDHNAALNILQAVAGLGQPNVAQWGERAAMSIGNNHQVATALGQQDTGGADHG